MKQRIVEERLVSLKYFSSSLLFALYLKGPYLQPITAEAIQRLSLFFVAVNVKSVGSEKGFAHKRVKCNETQLDNARTPQQETPPLNLHQTRRA
jgi:hypothetical protein